MLDVAPCLTNQTSDKHVLSQAVDKLISLVNGGVSVSFPSLPIMFLGRVSAVAWNDMEWVSTANHRQKHSMHDMADYYAQIKEEKTKNSINHVTFTFRAFSKVN